MKNTLKKVILSFALIITNTYASDTSVSANSCIQTGNVTWKVSISSTSGPPLYMASAYIWNYSVACKGTINGAPDQKMCESDTAVGTQGPTKADCVKMKQDASTVTVCQPVTPPAPLHNVCICRSILVAGCTSG